MTMGVKDDKDDLSDLTKAQMDSLKTWEAQFTGEHRPLYDGFTSRRLWRDILYILI